MFQIIIGLLAAAGSAYDAQRKGYNPIIWFLAGGGLIGILAISLLPDTTKADLTEEERITKVKKGNWVGAGIAILAVSIIIFVLFSI